jgi:hypothetical protein
MKMSDKFFPGPMPLSSVDSYQIYKDFTEFVNSNFKIENNKLNEIDINSTLQEIDKTTDPVKRQKLIDIQMNLMRFYRQAMEETIANGNLGLNDFSKFFTQVTKNGKIYVYNKDGIYLMDTKKPSNEEIELVNKANKIIKEYVPKFDTKIYIIPGIQDNNAAHSNKGDVSFLVGGKYKDKELFTKSDDVFSHEVGHFVLEKLNPKFEKDKSLEAKTIHESFADTVAFLDSAKDKSNREKLNLNNLYSENPISIIGEIKDTKENIIRTLYTTTDYKKLEKEEHILSVPITESVYHGWAYLVEKSIKEGKTKDEAIDYANAVIKDIITKTAKKTDTNIKSYLQGIINNTKDEELKKVFISEFSKRNLPFK